jgi:hypothetical protein
MKHPEAKKTYAEAENIAKGWSMKDGNGPAFIYLAKNDAGDGATFLCQYFAGELDTKSDQLDKYVESIRQSLAGSKLMAKGGANQTDIEKLPAAKVTAGMQVQLEDGSIVEITEAGQSRISSKMLSLVVKFEDGKTADINTNADTVFAVMRSSLKTESLNTVMAGVEELQETALEKLISDSLVEAYGNVAGYKLTGCEYLEENLKVNGTIYFTSGKTRNTTYTFSEAYGEEGKVKLSGLNEKLGLDKKFTLTGRIENKTLITESFSNK